MELNYGIIKLTIKEIIKMGIIVYDYLLFNNFNQGK